MVVSLSKKPTKLNSSSGGNDLSPSGPTEVGKSPIDRASVIAVIFLMICGVVLVLTAWTDTSYRFQEFEKRIALYKTEVYYFIPIGSAFLSICFLASKRWGRHLMPISVLAILLVGSVIGATTFSRQNTHIWATKSNGPVDLKEIAAVSPQMNAQQTWLAYMELREFLDGKTVIVSLAINPLYLNGFSKANVKVDEDFDSVAVPYDRMTGMEVVFEGPIYKNRQLFLLGEGDTYRFYSLPEIDYVVADQ